jgi:hypothetical protein
MLHATLFSLCCNLPLSIRELTEYHFDKLFGLRETSEAILCGFNQDDCCAPED